MGREKIRTTDIGRVKSQDSTCEEALRVCQTLHSTDETVYFVRCEGFVKIGYTKGTVESRMEAFFTSTPFELEILAEVPGGFALENALHRVFSLQKHRGEWFRYEGSLSVFISLLSGKKFTRRRSSKVLEGIRSKEEFSLITQLGLPQ